MNKVLGLMELSSYLTNKVSWVLLGLINAVLLHDSFAAQNIGSQQKHRQAQVQMRKMMLELFFILFCFSNKFNAHKISFSRA